MNRSDPYFLKTSRLGFRHWSEGDLNHAIGLWGDREVTRYIDVRAKLSDHEVRERLANEMISQTKYGIQYWPIFLLESNAHVGCCGLRPYDQSKQIYEIGFHIRSSQWRRGYGREAALAVIEYAFSKLKAHALFAGHHPKNEISRLLLKQLGFFYTHDEYYPPTGLDHLSYLLKANDYFAQRKT